MSKEDFDINALLGDSFVDSIISSAKELGSSKTDNNEESVSKSQELATVEATPEALETRLLSESDRLLRKVDKALDDVLDIVQSSPDDAELIEAAAKLVGTRAKLMSTFERIYLNKDKFKQQLMLTQMKLNAQYQMNQENNEVKRLASREEMIKTLMQEAIDKDIIKPKKEVIDVDTEEVTEEDQEDNLPL